MKRANLIFLAFCGLTLWSVAQNCSTPVVVQQLKDNRWYNGYVKNDGTVVADCIYYRARPFSEGLAAIRDINGIWGFIDTTGKQVITMPREVSEVGTFKEGLCWFRDRDQDLVGYIDRQGKVILSPQWGFAQDFSDGLAAVGTAQTFGNMRNITGLTGYIDHSGKLVISIGETHSNIGSESFNSHRAVINKFGEVTIIDQAGNTIVNRPEYEYAKAFSEGLCAVSVRTNWPCENEENSRECLSKWGFIDTAGNMVIKPQYEEYGSFSEGVCAINTGEGYAFIDQTGENVMGRLFKKAKSFSDGVAYVEEMNGSKTFIDHSGKTVVTIPDGFTVEGSSSGGLIEITKKETSDGIASNVDIMINHKGEEVWKYEWLEWVGYGE